MAGVNFKIRGNSPPFNVELRKNSTTGELIAEKTVTQSGTTESFLSLDYDTNYYLIATDSTSKTSSTGFTSVDITNIDININEFYNNFETPSDRTTDGSIAYQECIVCGCLEHNPSLSSGQSYDLDFCYDLQTIVSQGVDSLSRVKIFNDSNQIFCKSVIDTEPQSVGSYTVESINNATSITYEAYSCVNIRNPELTPIDTESGCSKTCIWIDNPQNMVDANLSVSSPYCTNIDTCAINYSDGSSPTSDKTITIATISDEATYGDTQHVVCGCINNAPSMVSGDRYDLEVCYDLHTYSDHTLSGGEVVSSCVIVCKNSTIVDTCSKVNTLGDEKHIYTIDNIGSSDKITFELIACADVGYGTANSRSTITLNSVSDTQNSDFVLGSGGQITKLACAAPDSTTER